MKIAIMQPYFLPYIGYFQLVKAVDLFVFYDDVTFMKGGWINRNYLSTSHGDILFTIPIVSRSSFRLIKDTEIDWNSNRIRKFLKTLEQSCDKEEILSMVKGMVDKKPVTISELASDSVKRVCHYLGIDTKFKFSSEEGYPKVGDKAENLIEICKREGATHYINPMGGRELYSKKEFAEQGIQLNFISACPSSSIISKLITEPINKIKRDLNNYELI